MKEKHTMKARLIRAVYAGNGWSFALTMAAMLGLSGFNLLISWMLQRITDLCVGQDVEPVLAMAVGTAAALAALAIVFQLMRWMSSRFARRAMRQYRELAFDEITRRGIASLGGGNMAAYISALTSDAAQVEEGYVLSLFAIVQQTVGVIGALAMMLWYSPLLTVAAVLLALLPAVASMACGGRLARAEEAVSRANAAFVDTVRDMLSGFTVIKSFKAEDAAQRLFAGANTRLEEAKYERHMAEKLLEMIGMCASVAAQMGVFLLGAYLAVTGRGVTPGMVVVFVQLMGLVVEPIRTLPQLLARRRAADALIGRLADAVASGDAREGRVTHPELGEGIRFENVTFGYEPGKEVLHGVSLTLRRGGCYAVVGGSGSGKSTLLSLLMGGYPDYGGSIRIGGDELRDIDPGALYDMISIVQQSVFVFNSTLRENITMFKDFDDARVRRAMELSGLSTLAAEKGEDYPCGENGSGLSGGERQRVAIARSLLREAPVLLSDEATAALDAQTAYAVTDAMLSAHGLTRVLVTHRLEESLLRRFDGIIVMRRGEIVEQGSYDALMEKNGYFAALCTAAN